MYTSVTSIGRSTHCQPGVNTLFNRVCHWSISHPSRQSNGSGLTWRLDLYTLLPERSSLQTVMVLLLLDSINVERNCIGAPLPFAITHVGCRIQIPVSSNLIKDCPRIKHPCVCQHQKARMQIVPGSTVMRLQIWPISPGTFDGDQRYYLRW